MVQEVPHEAPDQSPGAIEEDESLLEGTLVDLFRDAEARYADGHDFLVRKEGGRWVGEDYFAVRKDVLAIAAALVDAGIKQGDKVAIMSRNRPEWAKADLGILHAGGVSVPIYDTITADQVRYILDDSGAKVAFAEDQEILDKMVEVFDKVDKLERIVVFDPPEGDAPEYVETFEAFVESGHGATKRTQSTVERRMGKVAPGDLASLVYTSGTTGEPKGVMLTHDNFHSNAVGSLMRVPIKTRTLCLSFLPLSHAFERVAGYYIMIAAGATIHYAESVADVPQNILEVRPEVMASVPRLYEKMYAKVKANVESSSFVKRKIFAWALGVGEEVARLEAEGKPVPAKLQKKYARAEKMVFSKIHEKMGGRLQFFVSGGAALSPEVELFFNSLGVRILQGYGLTETSPVATVNAPGETRFGSVGRPIPGVEVRIAEDGEVMVKGKCVMKGYWKKEKATKEVLSDDGWLATGDVGRIDEEGFLYITDRKKELIVLSNGKNVAPQPIENLLKTQPHIAQAVLIGDGRNYCTALIAPDFEVIQAHAEKAGLGTDDPEALVAHPQIQDLVRGDVEKANGKLARYEQIKKFRLLPRELTQEAGELTPTLKTKRRVVDERYEALIEGMYQEAGKNGTGRSKED